MSCKDPKDERAEFCLYGHNMIPNPKKGVVEFSFASGSELCTYWSQIHWIETDECIPPIQVFNVTTGKIWSARDCIFRKVLDIESKSTKVPFGCVDKNNKLEYIKRSWSSLGIWKDCTIMLSYRNVWMGLFLPSSVKSNPLTILSHVMQQV